MQAIEYKPVCSIGQDIVSFPNEPIQFYWGRGIVLVLTMREIVQRNVLLMADPLVPEKYDGRPFVFRSFRNHYEPYAEVNGARPWRFPFVRS